MVCAARAMESARGESALFHDPFAAYFAGAALLAELRTRDSARRLDGRIAVRTRFFDDALVAAIARAPGAQVVLLGAGLDARAWRMRPPPGAPLCARVLEIDRGDVLAAKERSLAALPGGPPSLTLSREYAAVSADLRGGGWAAALAAAGHELGTPTVWLCEGLLYYLPTAAVEALLRTAARLSAPGSSLLTSSVNAAAMRRAQRSPSEAMRSFCSAIDSPVDYFGAFGWRVLVATRPGEPECSFGRFPPPPADEGAEAPRTHYVACSLAS